MTEHLDPFSPREKELIGLLMHGLTNVEIAEQMQVSRHTVKNYLVRISRKAGASNRRDVIALFGARDHIIKFARHTPAEEPPNSAKYLLFLVPSRHRDHLLGDLQEEYFAVRLPQDGVRRAKFWYWRQIVISAVLLLGWQLRCAMSLGGRQKRMD